MFVSWFINSVRHRRKNNFADTDAPVMCKIRLGWFGLVVTFGSVNRWMDKEVGGWAGMNSDTMALQR